MITLFFDNEIAPLAKLTVTNIGSISGAKPTPTAMANIAASNQFPFKNPLIRNIRGIIKAIMRIINQMN